MMLVVTSRTPTPSRSGNGSRSSTGTSRSLLEGVRVNDAEAWDRMVSLYAPLVAYWCRRSRLAEEDTADIFQDVFQAVASHIAGFRNQRVGDTFRGWLRTITHNKINDHFRRQGHEPRAIGGSEAHQRFASVPAPLDEATTDCEASSAGIEDESTAERRLFRRAMDQIRGEFEPRTWQAFWGTAVEGRATKDLADELKMSPGAVRVAKSRVLQRLREELGDVP